jgi:hypothetical protein
VIKLVQQGNYAAEVDVELIYTTDEWSPYLSLNDAEKLDAVRLALKRGALPKYQQDYRFPELWRAVL